MDLEPLDPCSEKVLTSVSNVKRESRSSFRSGMMIDGNNPSGPMISNH